MNKHFTHVWSICSSLPDVSLLQNATAWRGHKQSFAKLSINLQARTRTGMNKQPPLEQKLFSEVEDLTSPNVRLFVLQCMTSVSSCWASLGWSKAPQSCTKHRCLVQRCTSARAHPWGPPPAAPAFCHSHSRGGWWTPLAGLALSMLPILLLFSLFLACWDTRTLCNVYLHSILIATLQPTSCPCTVKITSTVPFLLTWAHCTSYLSYPHS